jgi:hypothetical protein
MRPKILLVGVLAVAASSSPSAAQLPPLPPLPDIPEKVEETKQQLEDDVNKAVGEAKQAVDEAVGQTPAPPTDSGSGGEDGAGDEGGTAGGTPARPAPVGNGGVAARSDGAAGSGGISHHCPGEGILGGGAGRSGPTMPDASQSGAVPDGAPTGEGVLGIESGADGAAGALEQVAESTGPLVLALFALGALLLLVGLGGGLRALQGRLRSG